MCEEIIANTYPPGDMCLYCGIPVNGNENHFAYYQKIEKTTIQIIVDDLISNYYPDKP